MAGIYADYGNPKGQIAVNFAALTRRFPEIPLTRMGLRVAPPKIPALISALQEKFALDDRNVADQATMKAEIDADLQPHLCGDRRAERFHAWGSRRRVLTSLLTLANSRLPQLAPLWAIGITRRRLAAIELLKTMSVALITTIFALPLGLLGGVVPARGRQRQGVRLAIAVSCLSDATAVAHRRRDGGCACRCGAPRHQAGAHAAGEPDQDFCQ